MTTPAATASRAYRAIEAARAAFRAGDKATTSAALRDALNAVGELVPFRCRLCDAGFETVTELEAHCQISHDCGLGG